jgi:hypothetical protein
LKGLNRERSSVSLNAVLLMFKNVFFSAVLKDLACQINPKNDFKKRPSVCIKCSSVFCYFQRAAPKIRD